MKVIKKPEITQGVCRCCGAKYLIDAKDLKKAKHYITDNIYFKCKFCEIEDSVVVRFHG